MISFLVFVGITLLLIFEGEVIAQMILGFIEKRINWWKRSLCLTLGLPIAAFMNVLIVFDCTVLGIPLNLWTLLGGHILVTTIAVSLRAWIRKRSSGAAQDDQIIPIVWTRSSISLAVLSAFVLLSTLIYSFAHAVLLPTFQFDSATNWTMRSQISFVDQKMAFDPNEDRGMAKPQYPFLFHALQITANQGQPGVDTTEYAWHDTAANAIHFLLSLSAFAAIFLILRRLRGTLHALVTTALLCSIPMLALHLAQGYGDITFAQYLLLSLVALIAWIEIRGASWIFLSAIFVAASVWTKSEGTFFGLAPWILCIALLAWKLPSNRKLLLKAVGVGALLSLPWHLFALSKGLLLTPHGSDFALGFHSEALGQAFLGLFSRGSFGISWYVIVATLALLFFGFMKKRPYALARNRIGILWGLLVLVGFLIVYLCTPNVQFLLNAESYYRQMMVAAAMLVLAISLCLSIRGKPARPAGGHAAPDQEALA